MAGPELLGVSAGTAFGAMASVMLFGITSGSLWFWLAGLASALATLGLLLLFNRKNGLAPEKVLLTGMALAALSDAAIRIWTAGGDFRVQQLLIWMSGSTYHATPESAVTVALAALALLAAVLPLQRWLALLSLDAVVAASAGVNVPAARLVLVLLSAVLTALAAARSASSACSPPTWPPCSARAARDTSSSPPPSSAPPSCPPPTGWAGRSCSLTKSPPA